MYDFNIIKNNRLKNKSFRVAKIYDQFDLNGNNYKEKFIGKIEVPEKWNIGAIVGKSGTGKTSIVNKLFKSEICEFNYIHFSTSFCPVHMRCAHGFFTVKAFIYLNILQCRYNVKRIGVYHDPFPKIRA